MRQALSIESTHTGHEASWNEQSIKNLLSV